MPKISLLFCTTLLLVLLFDSQNVSGNDYDVLNVRMVSQRGRNPYLLYNNVLGSTIDAGKKSYAESEMKTDTDTDKSGNRDTNVNFDKSEHASKLKNKRISTETKYTDDEEFKLLESGTGDAYVKGGPYALKTSSKLSDYSVRFVRIKLASLLRRNIIKAFGYILHRYKMELNSALYTSLYFMLNTIKLNQVNIIGILPSLKEVAFETSNKRYSVLFGSMEKHLPDYLTCAATFWKEAIDSKEVNMDVIFQPYENSALVVDIFEGMTEYLLEKAAEVEEIVEANNEAEKKILFNFNINILQIVRYIQNNTQDMKQTFLGSLLEYFPRSLIEPNLEESILVVVQYLEQFEIIEWKAYVSGLHNRNLEDPYAVVQYLISKLMENSKVPPPIKDSIQIILDNLSMRNPTAIAPYFTSISYMVDIDNINMHTMLKYIHKGIYPLEIVLAADRTIYYFFKAYIRHLALVTNFNPYIYSTPTEILLALLYRVIERQPDLPDELLNSARAIYSYLLFLYRHTVFPAVVPDDLKDIDVVILGLLAPDTNAGLATSLEKVILAIKGLTPENVKTVQERILVYKCSTPVYCFIEYLKVIQAMHLIKNPDDQVLMQEVLTNLTIVVKHEIVIVNSTLYPLEVGECKLKEIASGNNSEECNRKYIELDNNIFRVLPTTPTEGPPRTPTTRKATAATTPSAPPPSTLDGETTIDPFMTETPDEGTILELVRNTSVEIESQVKTRIEIMLQILELTQYKTIIEKSHSLTILSTFIMVLDEMKKAIVDKEEFTVEFQKFLNTYLENWKHVGDILRIISTEVPATEPIVIRLIVAVPAPTTVEEKAMFDNLKIVLGNRKLFEMIHDSIKTEDYRTTSSLLKAVLKLELKLKRGLSSGQRKAVQYYINKVQEHGLGGSKISWTAKIEQVEKKIDVSENMDNALGYKQLDASHKKNFNNIVEHLSRNPAICKMWDKWVYYTNSAEFTYGLFRHIERRPNTPADIKKAICELRPLINYDGNGLKQSY